MRSHLRLAMWAAAFAVVLGGFVGAPRAAKADVYVRLPSLGIVIGDHHRHRPRHYRRYDRGPAYWTPPRRHYGPPPRWRRYGPPPRRHHGWRRGPWRPHGHGPRGRRAHDFYR